MEMDCEGREGSGGIRGLTVRSPAFLATPARVDTVIHIKPADARPGQKAVRTAVWTWRRVRPRSGFAWPPHVNPIDSRAQLDQFLSSYSGTAEMSRMVLSRQLFRRRVLAA